MPLRCGRLDAHDPHAYTLPAYTIGRKPTTWHCNGHVVTSLAEQEWAALADNDERAADQMRRWWFDGMAEL